MIIVDACNINVFKKTLDRLNDLATSACQKVASMPIGNLYTGYLIFRINPKNLLIQFKEFDEGANLIRQASYAYDALGRRIEKVVTDLQIPANNKTRRYIYDGEDILLVLNENNEEFSKYTHSTLRIDDVLAIENKIDNKSYFYLKDHLGSIVDIVSEDNTSKQHCAYSSFGELQKVTDINGNDVTLNPVLEHHFAYTGREYDQESGLYHYRARAYDASTGRFLQVDPDSGFRLNQLTHINKYIYVISNPMSLTDPSGFGFFKKYTNKIFDFSVDILNETSRFIARTTDVEKKYIDSLLIVGGGLALIAFGGPVGAGAGVGLIYGGLSSLDGENPYDKGLRFAAVGGAAAMIGLGAGTIGSGIAKGALGTAIGSGLGMIAGYYAGREGEEFLGLDPSESAVFGATIGFGSSLGVKNNSSGSGTGKDIDWAGGRLIPK